jgi:hypothetical protein
MTEPTRYWLYGLRRNGRANWSQSYFAPNLEILTGNKKVEDITKAAKQSVSFMFEHEKFTGVIPSIKGVGYFDAMTKVNKEVVAKVPGQKFFAIGAKNPALSKLAYSNFFKEKFMGRTMSLQGPFNDKPILGLPAVVLDPQEFEGEVPEWAEGTHFMGVPVGITHRISQTSASTSVNFN